MTTLHSCPNATPTGGPGFAACEPCGKFFKKENARGRPPKSCSWFKEQSAIEVVQTREKKKEAVREGFTPVPVLEPVDDSLSAGDIVYVKSSLFEDETKKNLYSKEYKVVRTYHPEDRSATIIKHPKSHFTDYPVRVPFTRLFRKTGVEYIESANYEVVPDQEEEE